MRAWSAPDLVRRHAHDERDGPALLDGGRVVTWGALDAGVDRTARWLLGRGVTAGSRVLVHPVPPLETIPVLLAVLRIGAIAAPLPTGLTAAEVAAARSVIDPQVSVDPADCTDPGEASEAARAGPSTTDHPFDPDAPALIVLTSGTTGRPKGVVLSGRAMAASADAWRGALPPASGWLLAVGLAHVAGLGIIWRAIRDAVPVRVAPPDDPAGQLAALRGKPTISHVSLVPAQLARLLDACGAAPPPAGLRAVPLGGGSIPPALVHRALAAGWPVLPTYGLSETGSGATALPTAEADGVPGSAGRPLPGVRIRIDDPDQAGVGEIVVATPAAFSGYLGEPPRPSGAPVRTGDLGRLDAEGRLFVVDRRVDRIVRGGENVSPAEVEAALERHPAVLEAAVVGRPDRRWGQVPVAAIVLRPGARDPGDDALASHSRESLAGFKVPVAFVRLDALPRTAAGKLRRDDVRALVDGSPAGGLARPGGDWIGWRMVGAGRLPILLLPATLSNARQLDRLAAELARPGDVTVHALDRRGTGTGRRVEPGAPLDVAVHVVDIRAYLDARGIQRAVLAGHSFGGALALEAAARLPGRCLAVVAYEPPYGPLADERTRARFASTAARTAAAHAAGGPAAAAETFLRIVAGDDAWEGLSARSRAWLLREGDGAATDSALLGLDPDGLAGIDVPVRILTGGASLSFYRPIAQALVMRIPRADEITLPGLGHPAPISNAPEVAAAIRAFLVRLGLAASSSTQPGGPIETAR